MFVGGMVQRSDGKVRREGGKTALTTPGSDVSDFRTMLKVSLSEGVVEDRRQNKREAEKMQPDRDKLLRLIIDEGLTHDDAARQAGYTRGGAA